MNFVDFEKRLAEEADRTKRALELGRLDVARRVLADAVEAAPEQTGALKRSGEVREESVEVAFGVDYAAEVHENPHSSGHKFLETAAKTVTAEEIADAARGHRG